MKSFRVSRGLERKYIYVYHTHVSTGKDTRGVLAYLLLACINKLSGTQLLPDEGGVNLCLTLLFWPGLSRCKFSEVTSLQAQMRGVTAT